MNKYVVEVLEGQKQTAGSKAKEDIVSIMMHSNYQKLSIVIPKNKWVRLLKGRTIWKKELKNINKDDVILYQYPAYSRILGDYFIKIAKSKKAKTVALIHDIEGLRYHDNQTIEKEINFFNQFDYVISHNQQMTKWLQEKGVISTIVDLELFDYLEDSPLNKCDEEAMVFAGNLGKSEFLTKLTFDYPLNLYGINPSENYPQNISYQGSFNSSELASNMKGKYGLVWDGVSTTTCEGLVGDYMKYNNPHKVSLYLTTGLPVIIWKEAALASFIEDNNLGLTIASLEEIDDVLASISEAEYHEMKQNVYKLSTKIRTGHFIQKAMNSILQS